MPQAGAVDGAATLVAARRRERRENFPVALRLLPRRPRRHLHAVYAVARLIDEVGDDPTTTPPGRTAALDRLAADLDRIWVGETPQHPVLAALEPTVTECALPPAPFHALVDANRADQVTRRYRTFGDLRGYCALSAEPIGRLVLDIAEQSTLRTRALSDDVCTALQVLEHCQDVVEDNRLRDRVYLPLDDLDAHGVDESDLEADVTSPALRTLIGFEVDRAAGLLASGAPLVRALRGWARVAVAGYVAGGLATADAFARVDYDVVRQVPRPRRPDVVRHAIRLLAGRT